MVEVIFDHRADILSMTQVQRGINLHAIRKGSGTPGYGARSPRPECTSARV